VFRSTSPARWRRVSTFGWVSCVNTAAWLCCAPQASGNDNRDVKPRIFVPSIQTPANLTLVAPLKAEAPSHILYLLHFCCCAAAATVICNEWKAECRETVTESQLLDPSAPGAGKDAFALTATAACKLMGYTSFGAGTTRVTGEPALMQCVFQQRNAAWQAPHF
jgi:hypothetical protein